MSKYAAFGATLSAGIQQVETATIVVSTVTAGDANFILTADGMTGDPITTVVTLANGDSADTVATKAVTAMNLDSDITDMFKVEANGPKIIITRLIAAANDATLNLEYADDTSGGLTDDDTSDNTTAGVVDVDIAGIKNIGGPGLSLDTVDVTTHDSANGWEEVVGTVLRTGEITLDIVYDPADTTQYASAGGLIYRLENKQYTWFDLTFRSTYNWSFSGYVTGFEPGAPVDGDLTASVKIKITGVPTLEQEL